MLRHEAKDITTSVAWMREAWEEEALNDLPRNDEHWNCFKGNIKGSFTEIEYGHLSTEQN